MRPVPGGVWQLADCVTVSRHGPVPTDSLLVRTETRGLYFNVKCSTMSNKAEGLSDAVESPCHFYIVNVNATTKEKTRTFSE